MKRLNIALMAGGDSSEREIALQSAAQIASALDPAKYDITLIDLHGRDWHYTSPDGRQWQVDKNDFSITIDGDRKTFDYALILIHGTPGENGRLQGYLDMMEIPYSSCSMTSSVVTFDKITTKRTVAEFGIPLARGFFFSRDSRIDPKEIVRTLGLPVFVKPNASGSSFGVTKVKSEADILPAVAEAFTESDEILIEECIRGREMGCGMLIAKGREYIFPITEIVSKKEFFDYEAKYTAGCSDEITPGGHRARNQGRTQPPDGAGLQSLPLPGRGARGFHRHARGQALPDRNQFDSRHERRQHRPQTGTRSRHDARGTVRPDYRRHL